ncbi:glycoside hydrolase family protein [Mariniflexile sp. AS56]|uniref:glycoside hydrolase family protein n=1 Tax=Mariniflexile sp. AS56 TaxID=3063957 RepID=UPI0026EAC2CF|nr:glycoside hydrolase family protein [Mariniflexile sp. AS56]MDO7173149.1 glycoside hydrolase family protein [Mariniflexile sp. AS56]
MINLNSIKERSLKLTLFVFILNLLTLTGQERKSLVDYFLPMEPQQPLVSEGIWGDAVAVPRDTSNGLEDSKLKNWCYWDGKIVKDDDGKYHMYASRWTQEMSHSDGWHLGSKGMHAVSDNIMGLYVDKGLLWPDWKDGIGHNVIGLRMHDGRYAAVTSELTDGEIFVSDSPNGPFKLLGKIQVDPNGFDIGLARYQNKTKPNYGHMSNVKILLRPDGRYMLVGRSTAVMISDNGILGPYKIISDRVYKNYPELPQTKNEDPTIWYSGGLYHMVYNHWPTKTSHHFTSEDEIADWIYRGIAFKKDEFKIFKYTDGTINDWQFVERPTAYVENGHVTHFIFSVIDVGKGQDKANDNHGSKIVVVSFAGVVFDKDLQNK